MARRLPPIGIRCATLAPAAAPGHVSYDERRVPEYTLPDLVVPAGGTAAGDAGA